LKNISSKFKTENLIHMLELHFWTSQLDDLGKKVKWWSDKKIDGYIYTHNIYEYLLSYPQTFDLLNSLTLAIKSFLYPLKHMKLRYGKQFIPTWTLKAMPSWDCGRWCPILARMSAQQFPSGKMFQLHFPLSNHKQMNIIHNCWLLHTQETHS